MGKSILLLISVSHPLTEPVDKDARFTYDYYRLRVVGLIVAAVLCVIGVIILLAGKCRCKFNQNKRTRSNSGVATAQHLLQPGEATEC
ncbi:FXYD domain-containing ion transport regulator 3-like [Scyliorhinus torazame]|uniref:FXYD domain-containing ion transport regulator 3-like n=1 Tax=Scyliorhinus torazame TaxID=75743 RepID=UPI003B5B5F26